MTYFPTPNATGFLDLLIYSNVITENHFGELIMIAIFLASYMTSIRFGVERALAVSSFITAIASYFLSIFGLINPQLIAIPTIMTILSVIFLYKNGG